MAIGIDLHGVSRVFGAVTALAPLDLAIRAGEFFTLLGSSGSGKSTLIRIIGGFDRPTTGSVAFDGSDVTHLPANRRNCNTVFQDLALFPHMTVAQNVAYGLRTRGESRTQAESKVRDALQLVDLAGFEGRNIAHLSGGQRQRVALARSLVLEPGLLLLDEPLTGLDERLRQQMRDEFGRLHRKIGATFILVTHNQDEAMSLSDRMAIMHRGGVEQVGTPDEILNRPANEFVARFIGLESIITPESIERAGTDLRVQIAGQSFTLADYARDDLPAKVAIRPDRITLSPDGAGLPLVIEEIRFRGLHYDCRLRGPDGVTLGAEIASDAIPEGLEPGAQVRADLHRGALIPVLA
ncbi:MAG: ABC transporter ATP-binding protein [Rubellimicrobium sp.]|nr:ABC transporter ATP-binding protein [Rubellimicrobium sp.]